MPTTIEQLKYGFDRDSRRTWRQRATTQGWDNAYAYDSLSQVIGDDRGDLNLAQNAIAGIPTNGARWQYDETGNWHGYQTLAGGAETLNQARTHDKGNRLMEVSDAAAMRTDRAGRMLETVPGPAGDWDNGYEITWDAWSRITAVALLEEGSATPVAAYAYDGLTRRITRYTNAEGVTLHSYYNDEWRPLEERKDSETTAAASYLWGARHRDDLVRRDRAVGGTTLNETRHILMDYFSPAAIADEAGEVTERYQFNAFGLRTILNPDYTIRTDSECGMEFGFQGQFEDTETGWLNYGYRYYLPELGRWTSKDPIGIDGGLNLYIFVNNIPLRAVDHLGLCTAGQKCGCQIAKYDFQSNLTKDMKDKTQLTKVGGKVIEQGVGFIGQIKKLGSYVSSAVNWLFGVKNAAKTAAEEIVDSAGKKTMGSLGAPSSSKIMGDALSQMQARYMEPYLVIDAYAGNQEIYLDMTVEYKECKCGLFFNSYETLQKSGRDGPWIGMPRHQAMLIDTLYARLCGEAGADFDPCP